MMKINNLENKLSKKLYIYHKITKRLNFIPFLS